MDSPGLTTSPESVELSRLRTENAQLLATIQAARMPASPAPPWRRSGAMIIALAAIVAAVVPLTTAVQGWMRKNRELALGWQKQTNAIAMQRERQAEDIRTSYLERPRVPGERLRTLRFVIATTNDSKFRAWAIEEKKVVEDELRKPDDETKQAERAPEKVGTTSGATVARLKEKAPRIKAATAQIRASQGKKEEKEGKKEEEKGERKPEPEWAPK